jgi:hypothetical protein
MLLLLAAVSTSAAMYCLMAVRSGATSANPPAVQSATAVSTGPRLLQDSRSIGQSSRGNDMSNELIVDAMLNGLEELPCLLLLLVCALLPAPGSTAVLLLVLLPLLLLSVVSPMLGGATISLRRSGIDDASKQFTLAATLQSSSGMPTAGPQAGQAAMLLLLLLLPVLLLLTLVSAMVLNKHQAV